MPDIPPRRYRGCMGCRFLHPVGGGTVENSVEYIVAAGAVATYEALTAVVRERHLTVVEADARHLRLTFQRATAGRSGETKALCAVLDVGHGL